MSRRQPLVLMPRPLSRFSVRLKSGDRFGKLTVLSYAGGDGAFSMWQCACDCGRIIVTRLRRRGAPARETACVEPAASRA